LATLFLVVACGLYTHYLVGLAALAELAAAMLVLRPRRPLVACGAVVAASFASLLPWLRYAAPQFQHTETPFWVEPLHPAQVIGMLTQAVAGPPAESFMPARWELDLVWGAAVVAGVALIVAAMQGFRAGSPGGRKAGLFLVLSWAIGLAVLLLVSLVKPVFEPRYAGILVAPALPLLGIGLARLRPAIAGSSLAVLLVAAMILARNLPNPDFLPLARQIDAVSGRADVVAMAGVNAYFPLLYVVNRRDAPNVHIVASQPIPWFDGTAAYLPQTVVTSVPDAGGLVYVVLEPGERGGPRPPRGMVLRDIRCVPAGCLLTYSH
jgi:hypothetical protein